MIKKVLDRIEWVTHTCALAASSAIALREKQEDGPGIDCRLPWTCSAISSADGDYEDVVHLILRFGRDLNP